MHGGLMHEHEPREAALIERTLKSGMHDPSILHSFQLGCVTPAPEAYDRTTSCYLSRHRGVSTAAWYF